jgi:hypothetical protein
VKKRMERLVQVATAVAQCGYVDGLIEELRAAIDDAHATPVEGWQGITITPSPFLLSRNEMTTARDALLVLRAHKVLSVEQVELLDHFDVVLGQRPGEPTAETAESAESPPIRATTLQEFDDIIGFDYRPSRIAARWLVGNGWWVERQHGPEPHRLLFGAAMVEERFTLEDALRFHARASAQGFLGTYSPDDARQVSEAMMYLGLLSRD